MDVILGIPGLSFNNAKVEFAGLGKLNWRLYMAVKALPTTNWVELMNKKEFVEAVLNENYQTFVVHITALKVPTTMPIHLLGPPRCKAILL